MKIQCPCCNGEFEINIKVKGAKKKEKVPSTAMPRDAMFALTSHYLTTKKAVNNPNASAQLGRIYKAVKTLYTLCNGDVDLARQKITQADLMFADMGCSWTIETVLKPEWFSKIGETKRETQYAGWGEQ